MYDYNMDLKRLENEIIAFEEKPIEKGKILFYGHSYFTRWGGATWGVRPLEDDIRGKDGSVVCVNHGFGGSTSEDLLYFYPRAVRPWEPKVLVLISYSNDLLYGYSPEDTMINISKICKWARTDFPGIRLFLVGEHPHPSQNYNGPLKDTQVRYYNNKTRYNELLKLYADTHEDTTYIDLWACPDFFETPEDVGNFRKVRTDIFDADKVHPNQAGYDIIAPIFREALAEFL